jgi:hypothetical protein
MLAPCVVIVAVALFIFSLVLWTRGYRELSQNGEGTGLAFFAILAAFVVGVAGAMFAFPHWRENLLEFGVFVFLIAVGAFQIGIATHGLIVGYIRETGEEERRISGRYFEAYDVFVMPTGREVDRNDEPVTFWVNVMLRAGGGLGAVFLPVLMVIYRSIASH